MAGAATAVVAVAHSARTRRLDALGLLVAAELGVATGLAVLTNDPRAVPVRPALYLAVAGLVNLAAVAWGRPLTYAAAFPMATKGDPDRVAAYGRAWDRSAEFRRLHRQLATALGAGFLAYALIRVVAVFALSIGEAVMAREVPGILLVVGALGLIRARVPALRRIVDAEEHRPPAGPGLPQRSPG